MSEQKIAELEKEIEHLDGRLERRTVELVRAMGKAIEAEQASSDAGHALKVDVALAIMNGEIVGKNVTEREAAAREFFADRYAEADKLERAATMAASERREAELRLDLCREKRRLLWMKVELAKLG